MHIALLHPFSWPNVRRGGERYLHDLGWYLRAAGHDVAIITGRARWQPRTDEIDGVAVHRVWRHRSDDPWSIETASRDAHEVAKTLRAGDFDIAHALWPTAVDGARRAGTLIVYSMLGMPDRWLVDNRPRLWRRHRHALRNADIAAGLSRAAVEGCRQLAHRDAILLPPGVRTERFPADLRPRSGPPRLLFAGSLQSPGKGLATILAAMPALLEIWPRTRLRLSGPGDPSWAFERLSGPATRDRVHAATDVLGPGGLADLPHLYAASTVTLLPSAGEAFGLVLVESLATGTPVIGSQSCGPADIVDDPAVGRTVPARQVVPLVEAVTETVQLAARADTPRRCVAHVRRWDWRQRIGPAHEAVYDDLLNRGPPGP